MKKHPSKEVPGSQAADTSVTMIAVRDLAALFRPTNPTTVSGVEFPPT